MPAFAPAVKKEGDGGFGRETAQQTAVYMEYEGTGWKG